MNKATGVGLLAVLLVAATNGVAQKFPVKKLNPAQLERAITLGAERLAPRVPCVYIPAGTTVYSLEKKIAQVAQKNNIKLNEKDVHFIATHPEALQQFQVQTGMAVFEGRPVPVKKGVKILKANQEKFAQARANGEYETAWNEFIEQREIVPARNGKSYKNLHDIANDVYNFYVKHIGIENLPRVRMIGVPEIEAEVLEIPVNGLSFINSFENVVEVSAEKFVVMRYNSGIIKVVSRMILETDEYGQSIYRVIK